MRYSENLDYLVAAITALGSHEEYWARRSSAFSVELGLEHEKLDQVLSGFPGVFRKVVGPENTLDPTEWFSLQKRYALRTKDFDRRATGNIRPLSSDEMNQILEFVLRAAQMETEARQASASNAISTLAAVIAAISAIVAASLP